MNEVEKILFDGRYVRHYYDPKPGDLIYHYTSVEAANAILNSDKIWLSEYQKTNDTSEFTFAKQKFAQVIESLNSEYTAKSVEAYQERLQSFEQNQCMLIGSFTKNPDDLSQWDRYADSAKGCVIGFNAYWFWKFPGIRLHEVIYESEYLRHLVDANLYILERAQRDFPSIPLELFASQFVFEQFCFKDPRFVSEREIRMTRSVLRSALTPSGLDDAFMAHAKGKFPGPFAKPFEIKTREGVYGSTRYIELPFSFRNSTAVKSIGFGPRCSEEDEARVRHAFRTKKNVRFWRSDLPIR